MSAPPALRLALSALLVLQSSVLAVPPARSHLVGRACCCAAPRACACAMGHHACRGHEHGAPSRIASSSHESFCVLAAGGCGGTAAAASPAATPDYLTARPLAVPPPPAFARTAPPPASARDARSEAPPLPPPRA